MRKIHRNEERKKQLLYQFLERLDHQISGSELQPATTEAYIQQYIRLVQLSFSANVLHKGIEYASRLYNHIVSVEYHRVQSTIIAQDMDEATTSVHLKRLKQARNQLLKQSPFGHQSVGIDLFYQFTGGNQKKYKTNRRIVTRMYDEIRQASETNFFRFITDGTIKQIDKLKKQYSYLVWVIKSYTWH